MALIDISEVTSAVITIITNAFTPAVWSTTPPQVFPEPPNKLVQNGLAFYLYHAQENAAFKNYPAPGSDNPPVRFTSLALNLFYQLTAHFHRNDGTGALDEQKMMGIAMKALHDNPVVILPDGPDGSDNRIRISLQPITYNEAAHYWTAGTHPIKFAAYYEITVVLLPPERTQAIAGRVLSYGNFVFPDGMPRISGTRNVVSFTPPGAATPQQLTIEPAQVSPLNKMEIYGSSWGGDSLALQFYSNNWTGALVADVTWGLVLSAANQLTVTIPNTVNVPVVGPVNILPGMYSVQIVVNRRFVLSDGSVRILSNLSNQSPFTVTPRIDSITFITASVVEVKGFFFVFPQPSPPTLDVFLGATRLDTTGGPPGYAVTATNTLHITMPAGIVSGQQFPLRIMMNGAESAPAWIVVP